MSKTENVIQFQKKPTEAETWFDKLYPKGKVLEATIEALVMGSSTIEVPLENSSPIIIRFLQIKDETIFVFPLIPNEVWRQTGKTSMLESVVTELRTKIEEEVNSYTLRLITASDGKELTLTKLIEESNFRSKAYANLRETNKEVESLIKKLMLSNYDRSSKS